MELGGLKFSKLARLILVFVFVVNQFSLPALAFKPPDGALVIQRILGEGQASPGNASRKYNLSYIPVLLDLARVMGRFQLPPHMFFYIEDEAISNHPGIDLRTLLLKLSGPLKVPEGLDEPDSSMPSQFSDQPELAVPQLDPDASSEGGKMNDGSVPQLAVTPMGGDSGLSSVQPTEPPTQVASPDKINLPVQGNELSGGPLLSFDIHGMSSALGQSSTQLSAPAVDIPRLRSTFPTLIAFGEVVHNATPFIFWTCHASKSDGSWKAPTDASTPDSSAFKGTFAACRENTKINWIRNRHIGLQHGRMLAVNRGGDLGVDTALGTVSIDPGAAAIVDYQENKVLRVMSLESSAPGRVVVEVRRPDGTGVAVRLLQGEALIVSLEKLPQEDVKAVDGVSLLDAQEKENNIRARFTMSDLLAKEILLDVRNPELSSEERSALSSLRQRLIDRNMAGKLNTK